MKKKIKKLLKYIGYFFLFLIVINIYKGLYSGFIDNSLGLEKKLYVTRSNDFAINSFRVDLDVKVDNKVDVTEYISTEFYACQKRGIVRYIPEWLEYTDKNGNRIKRKSIIKNLRAEDDPFSLDVVNKKKRIKIGDEDTFIGCVLKDYIIKYTYDMGKDPFKGFDEFIFHAFGDYWPTDIKEAEINITMPKFIEGYNINFFFDKNRLVNINNVVDYHVEGNKLSAKYNREKALEIEEKCEKNKNDDDCKHKFIGYDYKEINKSITIDIELPDGYFKGGSWNYGIGSFLLFIVVIILAIYVIIMWFRVGKNHPKRRPTVEFYPPDELSAAEIGYIYNDFSVSKKLPTSIIIQLASKGYIKIDEEDKELLITNMVPEPKIIKGLETFSNDTVALPKNVGALHNFATSRVIEVKDLKKKDVILSEKEKEMYDYLFKDGDTKILVERIDEFVSIKDRLVELGCIEILNDNNPDLKTSEEKKKEHEETVKEYEKKVKEYEEYKGKLKPLTSLEKIIFEGLFSNIEDTTILSENKNLYTAYNQVNNVLKDEFKPQLIDDSSKKNIIKAILISVLILIITLISYHYVEDLPYFLNVVYSLSFNMFILTFSLSWFMGRKSLYGEEIIARVEGFRKFLIDAEKSRIEELVAENPKYFYDILPYTYVLDVSKKWVEKFENVYYPKEDLGNYDYFNDLSKSSLLNDIYIPASSGSGGSCGGGGSSCGGGCGGGGGCSSCGGGGSW